MPQDCPHQRLAEYPEPERGASGELDQFWTREIERRRSRTRSWAGLASGGAGMLATGGLWLGALAGTDFYIGGVLMASAAAVAAGVPSAWLALRGAGGVWQSWESRPPVPRRSASKRGGAAKNLEQELLEVIERHGEITPARGALETSLTVEEAERKLSELTEKGHLEVRVEGGKLLYAL